MFLFAFCAVTPHAHAVRRLSRLTAIFFTLFLAQIQKATGGVPINMILDEAGNIGAIPRFDSVLTLVRAADIAVWLGLQAPSQLDSLYGRDRAQIIMQTCATKIVLAGADLETAKYVSESLGDLTVTLPTESRTKSKELFGRDTLTKSEQRHARRLLTPDEVRQIEEDAAIVLLANRAPMMVRKMYYDNSAKQVRMRALGAAITTTVQRAQATQKIEPTRQAEPVRRSEAVKKSPPKTPPPMPDFSLDL